MERKMLFSMYFFLIVVLAAQEAVVQIEAAPCVIRTTMFTDPCISEYDSISCYHTCKINKYLLGGTCKKEEVIVQIEACDIICLMFPGECKGFGDNEICNNVCKINKFLFGGYCISGKCICYAKVY
ncbi:nodulin-1-like isoform X1 [Trifolium pratense]|uniref:nodulin-1-like isoform X1 n=1 Tax=Trifolium pratense TaxID=57577 RepID=UPI001E693E6C|nr:nodulin-1-like isoform X1 [Trifolium pratense]